MAAAGFRHKVGTTECPSQVQLIPVHLPSSLLVLLEHWSNRKELQVVGMKKGDLILDYLLKLYFNFSFWSFPT